MVVAEEQPRPAAKVAVDEDRTHCPYKPMFIFTQDLTNRKDV